MADPRSESERDNLPPAILKKALDGELVPTEATLARAEGRDYESAEQLLARIASEHAKVPTPARAVRRSAKTRVNGRPSTRSGPSARPKHTSPLASDQRRTKK